MSLSRKLSLIVSIVVLVGVLILAVISNTYTTNLLSEREEEAGLLLGQSVLSALDSEVDAIKIAVEVIANDPETQRLFYERDREGLLELYSARYDLLKDEIYQFQFHLPDSTSFLRLHSPEKYGDSLYDIRQTVNEANATGQTVMGLEGGVAGYGVRVVVPMFYNGEAIGSVEFGNRFDDTFLTSTQEQFGGEAYFIYLFDTEAVEDGTIPFLAGTQETDNWPLEPAVTESLYNGEIEYIVEEGSSAGVVLIPFTDYSGEVKGYIKVINDRTEVLAQIQQTRTVIYGIAAAIAVIVFILLTLLINQMVRRPLKKISEIAGSVARGDFDIAMDMQSNDEIGVVANAFSETVNVLKGVINDVETITQATMVGDHTKRGDISQYEGAYGHLITDINGLVDVFVKRLDAIPFPTILMDTDYQIKFVNQAGVKAVGTSAEQILGQKCYELLQTDLCDSESCPGRKALAERETVEDEVVIRNANYATFNTPVEDYDGNLVGQMEILVDQTEIKNAQLESQQAQLKAEDQAKLIEDQMLEAEKQADIQKRIADQADEQAKEVQKQVELAKKVSDYQEREVEKLVSNLSRLAVGDLSISIDDAEYDEDTESIAMMYQMINMSLGNSVRAINGYIEEITQTVGQMAEKDFTGEINGLFMGDFMRLKDSINHILEQMNQVLSEIQSASGQVEAGTEQIADASSSLAEGSSEQASSIQEISATITEIASQTRENAVNANKANELSEKARKEAQSGNEQMSEMLAAMDQISESSQGIAKIIKVIDDIAFQTNILALNAAVEAARAGEHGKGFAVVAEEVRTLAARSAQAAKETTELIESSVETVEEGNKMAQITAESLEEIVKGISDAVDIVGQIAQASNEQATAINEINIGVDQIAEVTQRNTATAEESASASQQIASQAQILESMVSDFKLK
ncbi:methyl-accepting chemotaxis protein [Eubacteriaceae bacterium ES3]|nr:methyl-accepting chemotaxis protein [Eubacteriaceae bacterium ES3]